MHSNTSRTTPIGLSRYAREFFDIALVADEAVGEQEGYETHAPVPVMYLVAHAIELSLKAFLVFNNVSLKELASRNYGHNLESCFEKSNQLGLVEIVAFEPDEIEGMKILNALYHAKELNYIVTGHKRYPVFGPIEGFTERLLAAVESHVGYVNSNGSSFRILL